MASTLHRLPSCRLPKRETIHSSKSLSTSNDKCQDPSEHWFLPPNAHMSRICRMKTLIFRIYGLLFKHTLHKHHQTQQLHRKMSGMCLLCGSVRSCETARTAVLIHRRPPDERQNRRGGCRIPPLCHRGSPVRGARPPENERVKALAAAVAVGRHLERFAAAHW